MALYVVCAIEEYKPARSKTAIIPPPTPPHFHWRWHPIAQILPSILQFK